MNHSRCYVKVVEWSETDSCYVGSCPGLLYGGCHGDDQKDVYDELCQIVDATVELYLKDGKKILP